MITVLAGGVGAARFLRGLVRVVDPAEVTVIVNVGDDIMLHGLHISPDLDSITYWLSGTIHPGQQWGRADESFTVAEELKRFGSDDWFTLGDRDLATHLFRTQRMREGATLTEATAEIVKCFGIRTRLLPATDDAVATRITTSDGADLHFQEYWVRDRASHEVSQIRLENADVARPAPGVVESINSADVVLFAPSNPAVSIGTILEIPGIREAVIGTSAPVIGISPIISGNVVRGMADRLLPSLGVEVSADGVARHYGSDLLDGWVIDDRDAHLLARIPEGIAALATSTLMDDADVAAELALTCLTLAEQVRNG